MATLLQHSSSRETFSQYYNLNQDLKSHGWQSSMDEIQAEEALEGKPAYTYLLRSSPYRKKYELSFVAVDGKVKHDHCTLIDGVEGVWINACPTHIGSLGKVIRDMMECKLHEGQPL